MAEERRKWKGVRGERKLIPDEEENEKKDKEKEKEKEEYILSLRPKKRTSFPIAHLASICLSNSPDNCKAHGIKLET